jgi:hypothetical protein
MNCFGNLIGHVADKVGKKKVAQELFTEVSSLMNIHNIQENTSGLTGESKHTLKKQYLIYGRKRSQINILTMMKLCLRNSRKWLKTMVKEG